MCKTTEQTTVTNIATKQIPIYMPQTKTRRMSRKARRQQSSQSVLKKRTRLTTDHFSRLKRTPEKLIAKNVLFQKGANCSFYRELSQPTNLTPQKSNMVQIKIFSGGRE